MPSAWAILGHDEMSSGMVTLFLSKVVSSFNMLLAFILISHIDSNCVDENGSAVIKISSVMTKNNLWPC